MEGVEKLALAETHRRIVSAVLAALFEAEINIHYIYSFLKRPDGKCAVAINAGYSHTCAVLADGTAKCWGYNHDGQLGINTVSTSLVPVIVIVTVRSIEPPWPSTTSNVKVSTFV